MWEWDNEEDLSYLAFIWGLRLVERVLIDCEYDSPCRSHYENNSIYFGIDIIDDRILDDVSKVVPIRKPMYFYFKPAKRSVPRRLRHKISTFMGGLHWGTNVVIYPPHRINI
ncbi:hypothetical protein O6H91_15G048200 [Diphasiastrum complanatum]|uniref:Uncharacterized protein n=1 Tax=Diphasiastrum complanatum TaxID=34168 RepID=A0ACC2BI20_DIPCM|nr:hypothetical protein O6H91_15G048200 [Diphasiastrum complanatum]